MYNLKQLISEINTDYRDLLLELYEDNIGYFNQLEYFLNKEYENFKNLAEIYPPKEIIFNAFNKMIDFP